MCVSVLRFRVNIINAIYNVPCNITRASKRCLLNPLSLDPGQKIWGDGVWSQCNSSLSGAPSKETACEVDTVSAPCTKQMQSLPGIDIPQNPQQITEVEPWWWWRQKKKKKIMGHSSGGWQVHFSPATYSMICYKRNITTLWPKAPQLSLQWLREQSF